ncbi:MAG: hypothetical protein WAL67_17475 [Candidatus Cybelea sp.]
MQAMGGVFTFEPRVKELYQAIARCDDISIQREILDEAPAAHRRRPAFPTVADENAQAAEEFYAEIAWGSPGRFKRVAQPP